MTLSCKYGTAELFEEERLAHADMLIAATGNDEYSTIKCLDAKEHGIQKVVAVNHAFSTLSTGGFSTKNDSLGGFHNDAIIWMTTVFMLLAGINFLAHLRLLYRDFSGYRSEEVRWNLRVFFVICVLLTLTHEIDDSAQLWFSATHSFFTAASVMTTTGFASADYGLWGHPAIALIFLAMLVGGNAGSTAGGVKVIRYVMW